MMMIALTQKLNPSKKKNWKFEGLDNKNKRREIGGVDSENEEVES